MEKSKPQKLKKKLVAVFSFLLSTHIALAVCFIFSIWPTPFFERNSFLKYYKDYAAIGPFFTEQSVQSTYLLGVSFKNDDWSTWSYPQLTNHQRYLKGISYQQLKRAEFEKQLSRYCLTDRLPAFQKFLTNYLIREYSTGRPVDSVRVMVLRRSGNKMKIDVDTLSITYYQVL